MNVGELTAWIDEVPGLRTPTAWLLGPPQGPKWPRRAGATPRPRPAKPCVGIAITPCPWTSCWDTPRIASGLQPQAGRDRLALLTLHSHADRSGLAMEAQGVSTSWRNTLNGGVQVLPTEIWR